VSGGGGCSGGFNPMGGGQQGNFNAMGSAAQAATGYGALVGGAPAPQATGMQAMGWGGGAQANHPMGMQHPMVGGMGGPVGQGGGGQGVATVGGMFGGGAPQAQSGAWNAFGGPGAGPRPPAPTQAQVQPGAMSAFGGGYGGMGGAAAGSNNVDDLMSKAMQGVSNLSLDQRVPAQAPNVGGMPMNMMMGNR